MKKFFQKQKGFTVLESMFAIFIISLAISGVFSAVQQSLSQAIVAKDEVRAYYLVQEGIEAVRQKRDSNQINRVENASTNGWLHGLGESGNPCDASAHTICRVEINGFDFQPCGSTWDSCANLEYDASLNFLHYAGGGTTNFNRAIQLEMVNSNEVAVTVKVRWRKGITTREITGKTHLFNLVP